MLKAVPDRDDGSVRSTVPSDEEIARWALHDPLVPADSPKAYEYLIVADAVDPPP